MEHTRHVVTLKELARRLRLSKRWLAAETKAGRIPSLKAGRQTLYNPEAVLKALATRAADGVGAARAE
jgi:excisionase family DNA binding protein